MALSAVHKVLKHGLIGESNPHAAQAMHAVADAVTLCRFEATDPDHDDVVLSKILHVLLECMRCPTGRLLSDDDVCNIVQACYRIGHQSGKESALLRNLSRHVLREIVHAAFGRLPHLPADGEESATRIDASVAAPDLSEDPPTGENGVAARSPADEDPASTPRSPTKGAGRVSETESQSGRSSFRENQEPFGLACVLEIFRFSVSFVSLEEGADEQAESVCAFGLQLVLASLESAGEDFARHPALLRLVRDDLSRAMLAVAPRGRAPVLAATAATILQLYMVMPSELKMQLEAFLRMALLPLADVPKPLDNSGSNAGGQNAAAAGSVNPGASSESRRVALECLVDLCRQPNFVPDLYVNFDCDVRRPNLVEELVALLSRGASPAQGAPLTDENLLSLEGLLAITAGVADRVALSDAKPDPATDVRADAPMSVEDFWGRMRDANGGVVGSALTATPGPARAAVLRRNRYLKRRLLACADHFNAKPKKGLAYMAEIGVLLDPPDPAAVADFLRHAPGLDKSEAGEFLGDHKEFNVAVLNAYVKTFDFANATLDAALRAFLDGFRLPGEAQKISRFLEAFAEAYFAANPGSVADADAAYVLSYSIIMLNTDQHNPQVKNKMTLDQFVRNNRGTNGGKDFPRETLEAIFDEIRHNEITLADDASPARAGFDAARWADMMRAASRHPDGGRMIRTPDHEEAALYDEDLFQLVWSPAVAATCLVFEHPVAESALKEALDGFLGVARVAGHRGLTDVMDHLITVLCAYASPVAGNKDKTNGAVQNAQSANRKPSVLFGEDDVRRTACVTAFTVANRYGDVVRGGWCPLVDLVLRMHRLDLLSETVRKGLEVDARDGGPMLDLSTSTSFAEAERSRRDAARRHKNSASGGSSLLRGFSQLLSLDGPDGLFGSGFASGGGEVPLTDEEQLAENRALRCVEACRIDDVFADASFLGNDSLAGLARALTWAAGPAGAAGARAARAKAFSSSMNGVVGNDVVNTNDGNVNNGGRTTSLASPKGESDASAAVAAAAADEDGAAFCLDVLCGVTLRCRDRSLLLLPHLYGYLRAIVASAKTPSPLVERAVFELLRIARVMLPTLNVVHDEADKRLAEDLLDALRLTFALEPNVADQLITRVASELDALVAALETDTWRSCAVPFAGDHDIVRTARGWDTVCKLLMASARHPEAAAVGFEALARVVAGGAQSASALSETSGGASDKGAAETSPASSAASETNSVSVSNVTNKSPRSHARPWNVRSCLEATSAFVDARQGGDERSRRALALLGAAADAVCDWCGGEADGGATALAAARVGGWVSGPDSTEPVTTSLDALVLLRRDMLDGPFTDIVSYLRRVASVDERAAVRDDATLTLQRVLSRADAMRASPEYWTRCFSPDGLLTGMLHEMCASFKAMPQKSEVRLKQERTAHLAVSCVAKTFLQRLPALTHASEPAAFANAWFATLDSLRLTGEAATCEELREAVPEAAKNMLLVMSAQGVLAPGAPQGLWEETWKRAAAVDKSLTPAIVGAK